MCNVNFLHECIVALFTRVNFSCMLSLYVGGNHQECGTMFIPKMKFGEFDGHIRPARQHAASQSDSAPDVVHSTSSKGAELCLISSHSTRLALTGAFFRHLPIATLNARRASGRAECVDRAMMADRRVHLRKRPRRARGTHRRIEIELPRATRHTGGLACQKRDLASFSFDAVSVFPVFS